MPALGTVNSTTSIATSSELAAHEADTTAIHGITDTAALATAASVTAHTSDTSDAHDASAVSVVPFATIAATDVQAALEEIVAEAGSGGVTDADYLVGTAHAGLSAEIVVGTSPGGELGGTWAAPTVDATHSGSAHHDAVTVGTGLDVTGQLVELDLSEVAAGGELGGFMDAPTVDATHSGSTHAATQTAAESTAAAALSGHAAAGDPHTGYRLESADHSHASTGAQGGQIAGSDLSGTPGGELGGTWASPTVDATHSGSTHGAAVTTHEAAADPHTGYVLESLLDAKGDIFAASADNTPAKLSVGANDTVLTADSSTGTGLKWATAAGGGGAADTVSNLVAAELFA